MMQTTELPLCLGQLCGPGPEAWEDYLILEQIAIQGLQSQSERFRSAYADVLQRLQQSELVARGPEPVLTPAGISWKRDFERRFLD